MPASELNCTTKSLTWLTPSVYELTLCLDKPIQFRAGQFFSAIIPGAGPGGRDLRRAYSIASCPNGLESTEIELCIKKVEGGPGSTYLASLRPGDALKGFAPYGDFVYKRAHWKPNEPHDVVFIATGTGVAPFRAMIASEDYQKNPPRKAWVLHGVRTEDELLYVDELKNAPIEWLPFVSKATPAWGGNQGRVTNALQSISFDWQRTDFYLCGNGAMIKEVKDFLLISKSVPKESVLQEKYY